MRVDLDPEDDPDDTYCEIPYEKGNCRKKSSFFIIFGCLNQFNGRGSLGYCFVSYLRSLVTSHEEFDEFLKGYVKKYSYQVWNLLSSLNGSAFYV